MRSREPRLPPRGAWTVNPTQADTDADGAGDACDDCVSVPNASQADADNTPVGDSLLGKLLEVDALVGSMKAAHPNVHDTRRQRAPVVARDGHRLGWMRENLVAQGLGRGGGRCIGHGEASRQLDSGRLGRRT